jgi:hypothetical protein
MTLIYGNVPRTLRGAYRYAQTAMVRETVAESASTTASYFETARSLNDINAVHCSIVSGGSYQVDVEVSLDDGVSWTVHATRTQDDPPNFKIDYTSPEMKLRMSVVSAASPVLCIMRQG